jgi:hypothetical protein
MAEKIADLYAQVTLENKGFETGIKFTIDKLNDTSTKFDINSQRARAFAGSLNMIGNQGASIDNIGMSLSHFGQIMNMAKLGAIGLGLEIGTSLGNMLLKIPAVESSMNSLADSIWNAFSPANMGDPASFAKGVTARNANRERWADEKKIAEEKVKQDELDVKASEMANALVEKRIQKDILLAEGQGRYNLLVMERERISKTEGKDRIAQLEKEAKLLDVNTQIEQERRRLSEQKIKLQSEELSLQSELADKQQSMAFDAEQAEIDKLKGGKIGFTSGGTSFWKQTIGSMMGSEANNRQKSLDEKRAQKARDDMVKGIDKVVEALKGNQQDQAVITA